jgi:hypothetical protein
METEFHEHEFMGEGESEGEQFEFQGEQESAYEFQGEQHEVFSESELQELAAELLSVSNEQELNHFLGGLMKKAASVVGKVVKSPIGQQLGGILKGAAKKALPIVGGALGAYVGGPAGAKIGSQLASGAGRLMGLELEGLSHEDREFEVAKQFVRFAGDATQKAVSAPSGNPAAVAKNAVTQAAAQYAPGLIGRAGRNGSTTGAPASGRWIRRGRKIVLYGA